MGMIPFMVYAATMIGWFHAVPEMLQTHFAVVTMLYGIAFSNMVGRMIVAHVVDDKFPFFHPVLVPLILGSGIPLIAKYAFSESFYDQIANDSDVLVYSTLVGVCGIHGRFIYGVITEICAYLDINCLTIKTSGATSKKSSPKKTKWWMNENKSRWFMMMMRMRWIEESRIHVADTGE